MFNIYKHAITLYSTHMCTVCTCFNFKQPCVHACMFFLIKFTAMMIIDINVHLFHISHLSVHCHFILPHHPSSFLHNEIF